MSDQERQHPHVENVGAWLLGALDEAEARDFAAELELSQELRDEVARLQPTVDALSVGVEQHAAPPELGARLMATVRDEAKLRRAAEGEREPAPAVTIVRRSWFSLHRGLAAGLATAFVALLVAGGVIATSGGGDGGNATTVQASVATKGGSGVLVVEPGKGGQLAVSGVPDPGAGRTYEVWLMPKGSTTPKRSTLFITGADGSASVHIPGDFSKVSKVLVTNEPAGGSNAPTSTRFVVQANV